MQDPFNSDRSSADDKDKKTAKQAVQKSFWSILCNSLGYEGNAAGDIGWKLVKAVRPEMSGHAESLAYLEAAESKHVVAMLGVARKTKSNATTPRRKELAADIVCMLQGLAAKHTPMTPPSPVTGVRRALEPDQAELDRRMAKSIALGKEAHAMGLSGPPYHAYISDGMVAFVGQDGE